MIPVIRRYRALILVLVLVIAIAGVGAGATQLFEGLLVRPEQPHAGSSAPIISTSTTADTAQKRTSSSTTEGFSSEQETSGASVSTTNGRKHLIPLDEIVSGGPGKDGIPSIDEPTFVPTDVASATVEAGEPGIGVAIAGEARFYPYEILVWHEIVNDTINGEPIAVTYCPLCRSGVVYRRAVNGEVTEFGVSGKLWRSNLLLYNRNGPESLWSQIRGTAVVGPLSGATLEQIPSQTVRFSAWRSDHPDTDVLARPTAFDRPYGQDPYAGYYTSERVSFGVSYSDTRLQPKELVAGITHDGAARAYPIRDMPDGRVRDTIGSTSLRVVRDGDAITITDASGARIPHTTSFWFAWVAAHPRTSVYQQ
jgi:hypothetical protein